MDKMESWSIHTLAIFSLTFLHIKLYLALQGRFKGLDLGEFP